MILLLTFFNIALANYGHRGCQDSTSYFKKFPENSMLALQECLQGPNALQRNPKMHYLEFDVQETFDGKLVLFHDDGLTRMFNRTENVQAIKDLEASANIKSRLNRRTISFSSLKIKDLTLAELRTLKLKGFGNERIPELKDYMALARNLGLIKPLILELKYVRSDAATAEMLDLMQSFYHDYMAHVDVLIEDEFDFPGVVTFLSFKGNIERSFGKIGSQRHRFWCEQVRALGLHGVYRPIWHGKDYCSAN
jgi:glycerophosphoryl diester phosphodiesterase